MKELTTTEAAQRLKVAPVTVRLWCKQGRFKGARSVDTPRGPVWYIPEASLNGVSPRKPGPKPMVAENSGEKRKPGRPRKTETKP